MKRKNFRRSIRAAFWGTLAGGAAGFVVGLLVAPEEGRKMRRRAAYWLDHLALRTGELIRHFSESPGESEARRSSDAVVQDAREQAEQILHDANALLRKHRTRRSP